MTDEELTVKLKLALDKLSAGRIMAAKVILHEILDIRAVVSQSVDDEVLKGIQ